MRLDQQPLLGGLRGRHGEHQQAHGQDLNTVGQLHVQTSCVDAA
jgi:hypothetical protein